MKKLIVYFLVQTLAKVDDAMEEDDDIQLQHILFYSMQFRSGKNVASSSKDAISKEVVEPLNPLISKSNRKVKSNEN